MEMAAIVLCVTYVALTFGARVAILFYRTGSTGVHGLDTDSPAGFLAGLMLIAALACVLAAPICALLDVVEPNPALDGAVVNWIGVVLVVTGIGLTFAAQLAMGDSWRIGVNGQEETTLVTSGPFRLVRNPIFAAIVPAVLGFCLMVPSVLSIAGVATAIAAIEMQVRLVEEPYLLRIHGRAYEEYAARAGRFVPRIGLL